MAKTTTAICISKASLVITVFLLTVGCQYSWAQCASGTFTSYAIISSAGGSGTLADPVNCNFTMEVCYDVTSFSEGTGLAPRAMHGIYITNLPVDATVGAGSSGIQNTSDGLDNKWIFLDVDAVEEGNNGDGTADFSDNSKIISPGFYVDGVTGAAFTLDNDPTNNYGDGGDNGLLSFLFGESFLLDPFCFSITFTDCSPAGSWTPQFGISNDEDTGSRSTLAGSCTGSAYIPSSSGPNGDGSIYYAPAPLGVEMTGLYCKAEEEQNLLFWKTITEENASWFIIERSSNGRDNFMEVGRLRANGFSNDPISYSFEDPYPLPIAYYRIQVVDFDGTYEYSEMVVAQRSSDDYKLIRVFPNPAPGNEVYIFYYARKLEKTIFMLSDHTGKALMKQVLEPVQGMNRIHLDLNMFKGENFVVTIINSEEKNSQRIIRQNMD